MQKIVEADAHAETARMAGQLALWQRIDALPLPIKVELAKAMDLLRLAAVGRAAGRGVPPELVHADDYRERIPAPVFPASRGRPAAP